MGVLSLGGSHQSDNSLTTISTYDDLQELRDNYQYIFKTDYYGAEAARCKYAHLVVANSDDEGTEEEEEYEGVERVDDATTPNCPLEEVFRLTIQDLIKKQAFNGRLSLSLKADIPEEYSDHVLDPFEHTGLQSYAGDRTFIQERSHRREAIWLKRHIRNGFPRTRKVKSQSYNRRAAYVRPPFRLTITFEREPRTFIQERSFARQANWRHCMFGPRPDIREEGSCT